MHFLMYYEAILYNWQKLFKCMIRNGGVNICAIVSLKVMACAHGACCQVAR